MFPLNKQYIPHSMDILFDLHRSLHSKIHPVDTDTVRQLQILHYATQGKSCILEGLEWKEALLWQVELL